jgi:ATP-binding cassette subfamily F protein 3
MLSASMLTLSNVSKSYGERVLFDEATFQVNRGDRTALVGANGAGKSTLFSIVMGEEQPDEGTVSMERAAIVGYLPQETAPAGDETVLQLTLNLDPKADDAEHHSVDPKLIAKAKRILSGLAFRESDFDRPAQALSGGWIMRAHLARLLVLEPDLLMLDEPTNHLDLESLGWFQNYLKSYPGAILMISHDRAFLNALVGNILEIRLSKVHRYRGNYDAYLEQRAARKAQHEAAYKNQQKEIESLQRFADRFRAKASKATQAQSKLRQIERMEKIEAPEDSDQRIAIRFPQPQRGGQRSITLSKIHQSYGDLKVYQGIDFEAERGQRTVLVGPNGAGKSTLLKILGGVLPIQQGERSLGHNVRAGYFAQNRASMFDPKRTVLQEVMDIENPVPEQTARTVLGSFLFRGDDVFKPTGVLSGGEKSRLGLVKILLNPPNLLLLDEPTTHLDMTSIDALIDALKQYEGTLIFISHDVWFIRALAKTVLHISAGKLAPYAGDYDYYLEKSQAGSAREGLVAGEKLQDARPEEAAQAETAKPASIFKTKDQKRREANERIARQKIQNELHRLEWQIQELETRQKELATALEKPEAYQPGGNATALNRELLAAQEELERLTQQWTEASATLEQPVSA